MSHHDLLISLINAIKRRDLDAVKGVVALGADPNGYHEGVDQPPMNEAACLNFVPGLEVLHAAGGHIDGVEEFHRTPLMTAAIHDRQESTRWLLHHGADVLIEKGEGLTALKGAIFNGNVNTADVILKERPVLRGDALTSLATFVIGNRFNANVYYWLLEAGVSPSLVGRNGMSWLMAVQTADDYFAPLSERLLAAGADVNFQDAFGRTALHRSAQFMSMTGFMRLLRAGANPDLADCDGQTVRQLLNQDAHLHHMHEALIAWEASTAAHQTIKTQATNVRPL